jgi:hypothetical protein
MKNNFPDIEIVDEQPGFPFVTVRIADAEIAFDFTGRVLRSDKPIELLENPEKYGLVPGNEKLRKILGALKERVENRKKIYDKINEKFRVDLP